MRHSILALFACASLATAQPFQIVPPKTPLESLKCIQTRKGFKVELMAAEPLVMDPIAFAWGPDGKFWVVEMGDYPLGTDGRNKPGGKVKYLEKSKVDGPYDRMTVFLDNLNFPTGVFPYGKGVLVTCAPDIFYAEIGKDGKAAKKDVLFTGFREGNQQHRVNGLTWGIDNWIYGANGDSGGIVKSIKTGKSVNISGRDFRFKVETGEFETVSGQSQFGRCRDDWGNWFGNNNSNPMFHFVLEDRYLKRNPHVLYPDVRVQVPVKPGAQPVYPISKPMARFNSPQALNHFTSACSTILYRDTLFGKEFEGNMFVSEPVHNLIHREIMRPKGVTFTSQRADDEQTSEFLASSDNWFRPAMIQVGPDGALWIADMYRYVIEHPEWIPKDWQKKLDLRAGHDLGRIYRVYPEDKKPREIVRMDEMEAKKLVKQLESPNGWVRDTAHQLLAGNLPSKKELPAVVEALSGMIGQSPLPQARLHALYVRHAFAPHVPWDPGLFVATSRDPHPALRKHGLAVMDQLDLVNGRQDLDRFEKDTDDQVRLQLAYILNKVTPTDEGTAVRLGRVLVQNASNPHILAAGLSSISKENWNPTLITVKGHQDIPGPLFGPLLRISQAIGAPLDSMELFLRQLESQAALPATQQMIATGEMLGVLEKNGLVLKDLLAAAGQKETAKAAARLRDIHADAAKTVADPRAAMAERMIALRLLGRGLGDDRADHKLLATFLTPQTPDDVQGAVIQQLGGTFDPRVPGLLLAPWKSYSPALRGQVLDTLLSRPIWARMTLEAIQQKRIPAQEIDAIRRQRLVQHKDEAIRLLAKDLFASASTSDRAKVVALYELQMPAIGDALRGAKLFQKSCAVCHKLGEVGQNVGPDLASVGDKSPQGLLTAILDPNKAVETRYLSYVATTKAGLTYNGILSAETSTTITLTANDGKTHQLLRNDLDELFSTGKSMMPEGLEKDLTPQDVADIIAHVRAYLPTPKRKEFPGNAPAILRPGEDGRLHLLPKNGAIFGSSIIVEKKYGNLGYWSKPDDQVIWKVELSKDMTFSVWLDFACAPDNAGNVLSIQCGQEKMTYKVQSTGSWDAYQLQSIGPLRIPAGTHEIRMRSDGPIRGALLDLKAVELRPR